MARYVFQIDFYHNEKKLRSRIVEIEVDKTEDPEVKAYEMADSLISESNWLSLLTDRTNVIQIV